MLIEISKLALALALTETNGVVELAKDALIKKDTNEDGVLSWEEVELAYRTYCAHHNVTYTTQPVYVGDLFGPVAETYASIGDNPVTVTEPTDGSIAADMIVTGAITTEPLAANPIIVPETETETETETQESTDTTSESEEEDQPETEAEQTESTEQEEQTEETQEQSESVDESVEEKSTEEAQESTEQPEDETTTEEVTEAPQTEAKPAKKKKK